MMSLRMFWLVTIVVVILCFTETSLTEAKHEMKKKNLPSAVVVGSVYCDTCFQLGFSKSSHFISGASVAVECAITGGQPDFHEEAKTNEVGEFAVHLPFSVTKRAEKIKKCSVKLIKSSEPKCAVASLAASSSLKLKSRKDGIHIFSAGFFTFKPPKQPKLCNQTPKSKKSSSKKLGIVAKPRLFFPNPFHTPSLFPPNLLQPPLLFPPNPFQPPSLFPPNPFQPPSLFPPNPFQPPSLFPPNPFQPPPSLLPPNPLLPPSPPPSLLPPNPLLPPSPPPSLLPPNPLLPPSPPPSLFPPNPFQPPSPPASVFPPNPFLPPSPPPPTLLPPITLPPIPGFTPSPPPPSPPPPFAIHLPPFPFQPTPGVPPTPPSSP